MKSGLYVGSLRHRRFEPRAHQFKYGLFMAFLDIDCIPELMAQSPFTSYNRFHWASFCERDHFGDPALPLRERVAADARACGVPVPAGKIFLLTHLRYLGYCFNPISLYFCYDAVGSLHSILAEVNSTFGETHNYWLTPQNQLPSATALHYTCPKALHVSPFMDMKLSYEFVLTEPAETLVFHMNVSASGTTPFFDATLTLQQQPWTSQNIAGALLRHPWMTVKVIAAIHWEALRLFWKRVPVFAQPVSKSRPILEASKKEGL